MKSTRLSSMNLVLEIDCLHIKINDTYSSKSEGGSFLPDGLGLPGVGLIREEKEKKDLTSLNRNYKILLSYSIEIIMCEETRCSQKKV